MYIYMYIYMISNNIIWQINMYHIYHIYLYIHTYISYKYLYVYIYINMIYDIGGAAQPHGGGGGVGGSRSGATSPDNTAHKGQAFKVGKLNLVDLAGSERVFLFLAALILNRGLIEP
jgi:hypothetical protein